MSDAPIQIVDEHDQPVGSATKTEAWQQGLRHRNVRIMAEDDSGRILLQKRVPTKSLYPNCWDHSASGHVDAGEGYETAAKRELAEEIGVTGVALQEIGAYDSHEMFEWRKLNRFNKVYRIRLDPSVPLVLQASEVSETRWFTLKELRDFVHNHPDQVTDGLQQVVERYYREDTQG